LIQGAAWGKGKERKKKEREKARAVSAEFFFWGGGSPRSGLLRGSLKKRKREEDADPGVASDLLTQRHHSIPSSAEGGEGRKEGGKGEK